MTTRVLVTGANGYIGSAVSFALRDAGYKVFALVRKQEDASKFETEEVIPVIGDVSQPEGFRAQLEEATVVIDCVNFDEQRTNNFFSYVENLALTAPSAPSLKAKRFVWTSGVNDYGDNIDQIVDESTVPLGTKEGEYFASRIKFSKRVLTSTALAGVAVRPGYVYGKSGGKLAGPLWFDTVKVSEDGSKGTLAILGNRFRRFPWIHIADLAQAYVQLVNAPVNVVNGELYNFVDYSSPTFEEIKLKGAELQGFAVNPAEGSSLKPLTLEYGDHPPGDFGGHFVFHNVINPQKTIDHLHWKPRHLGIIHELPLYFASWKAAKRSTSKFFE